MSRFHPSSFLVPALLLFATALATTPSRAELFVLEPPDVDRWNYPFASIPGTRSTSPLFAAYQSGLFFDERDAQALLIFDTAHRIPAGRPLSSYNITSARVVLDLSTEGSFVYDPTYDGYRTYLALENPADPDQLPDTDAGRPIELYGVGYRLAGLNALTYDESGTPFAGVAGAGQRYAYPSDNLAHPTSFGARDVSNNVLVRFEVTPFALGVIPGATPGATVPTPSANTVSMNLTLSAQVRAYLQQRLAQGAVDLMVTTLLPATQGGPVAYPVIFNKESGVGAATLEIDVVVTPDCVDGVDNDGDGFTDYPADPGCTSSFDSRETKPSCGLIGFEALPLLAWAARSRRRAARRARPVS